MPTAEEAEAKAKRKAERERKRKEKRAAQEASSNSGAQMPRSSRGTRSSRELERAAKARKVDTGGRSRTQGEKSQKVAETEAKKSPKKKASTNAFGGSHQFKADLSVKPHTLKVGDIMNEKLVGMDTSYPCIIKGIKLKYNTVDLVFEHGDEETDVLMKYLSEIPQKNKEDVIEKLKKLLIIVQGKEQKFFEKEAERLRAVDIVGVASGESEGEEDQSLFDHLGNDLGAIGSGIGNFFALNEESYYDSDPNDDGDGERKVRPKMFKGTLSDSRVQANGKPFFPRWLGEATYQENVYQGSQLPGDAVLRQRRTNKNVVFELENPGNDHLKFQMTFKGSKNFKLDKGGLRNTTIIEPQSIKEVAFLLVKNLNKPYTLKSKFVWAIGTKNEQTGEVEFPSPSSDGWFCAGGRGEHVEKSGGCAIM